MRPGPRIAARLRSKADEARPRSKIDSKKAKTQIRCCEESDGEIDDPKIGRVQKVMNREGRLRHVKQ